MIFAAAAFYVAYQAEIRVRKSELREVEAVAIAVGNKVQAIANSAGFSAMFMQGLLDHRQSNPEDLAQIDAYIIELAGNPEFPELPVLPEQIAALARADSNVAGLLAACGDRRADMQIASNKLANATPGSLTDVQLTTAQLMPYRLRELKDACKASIDALVALVPKLPKIMGPIPGTIGELVEAESSLLREKESGAHMELLIEGSRLKNKQDMSKVERKGPTAATELSDE